MDQQPAPLTRLPYSTAPSLAPVPVEPALRVGELERTTACDALAEHFAAGRLDPAELDDRLARAMAARTHADLQVLFRDLAPRRTVPAALHEDPVVQPSGGGATVPLLVSLLILSLLLAGGMLLVLGAYSPALFVAALVGGTATAVAGGCVTGIGRATLRRR